MRNPSLGIFVLITLALGALASPDALGQAAKKVWKVGILWHAAGPEEEEVMFRPFIEGMRELGYVEGRNLLLDQTYVDEHYERFQARAQELVDRQVDIILASVPAAAAAARRVTQTIPIVFATSGDPVKLGLVESLRRPGGTLTGLSTFYPELTAKHLEMLREIVPGLSRVALLWNATSEDAGVALQDDYCHMYKKPEWVSNQLRRLGESRLCPSSRSMTQRLSRIPRTWCRLLP